MPNIGPFFYIGSRLIFNACPLGEGRMQADKLDNSYGHVQLYDDNFRYGDYINFPRGRVVWDCSEETAIVYIDRCIRKPEVIAQIAAAFKLEAYTLKEDEHYRCPGCMSVSMVGTELMKRT